MGTGEKMKHLVSAHTHTKKHSYSKPQALDIPPAQPLKCLQQELFLPPQLLLRPWREKNPTCHFRYSARRKPVQTTWLGEVQCQCRAATSTAGMSRSVKGSFRDITIWCWMCCDLDTGKHLGISTCRNALVTFSSHLWHLSYASTAAHGLVTTTEIISCWSGGVKSGNTGQCKYTWNGQKVPLKTR